MSIYRNKCGVSGFLQGRVAGDLVRTRLAKQFVALSYDSFHPIYSETYCVHTDIAQVRVVLLRLRQLMYKLDITDKPRTLHILLPVL